MIRECTPALKKLSIKLHDTKSWNPSICKKNSGLNICAVILKRKHCFDENKVLSQNMKKFSYYKSTLRSFLLLLKSATLRIFRMVRMQFSPLDSSPADGCGWIVARRGRRPKHKVVNPVSFVLFIDHHGRDLCVEVVEPIVDVPVEPVLLLLDQLGQLRL